MAGPDVPGDPVAHRIATPFPWKICVSRRWMISCHQGGPQRDVAVLLISQDVMHNPEDISTWAVPNGDPVRRDVERVGSPSVKDGMDHLGQVLPRFLLNQYRQQVGR